MKAASINDYRDLARRRLPRFLFDYALAGGGQGGVAHVLKLIEAEMRVAMTLTGVQNAAAITGHALAEPPVVLRAAI